MATPAERAMASGWNIDLVMVDGAVEAATLLDNMKTMRTRHVREDDIFICTFPKSGTHWVWEIVNMIVAGKPTYAKHWQNISWLDCRTEQEIDALPSPRIIHTQRRPGQLPRDIWKFKTKVIYVNRNPKDAAVSTFAQASKQVWKDNPAGKCTFTGTWDEFVTLYQDGCAPFGSILEHERQWRSVKDIDVCRVQFEELKQDSVSIVKRLAEYLERPLSKETYSAIAEACGFENLKQASEKIKDQTYHNNWQQGSSGYFRKGQSGEWKKWFTVAQSERFDRLYEETLNEKFPY
ncbi:sulfotransferase 2B1-like [Haliotis asinina]|uniref:sulfotransferase 2B1-like n=1 Tax=Haliotis asinina TaxID=109174 RepID=UPI0035322B14